MKILFCSPCAVDARYGAAGVLIGLAEGLEAHGWSCTLIGPPDLEAPGTTYAEALHAYLKAHAHEYDVIDFDFKHLQFDRAEFPEDVLLVARAQLLMHHYVQAPRPPVHDVGSFIRVLKYEKDRWMKRRLLPQMDATFREADLVTVSNQHARTDLAARGIRADKILVHANGLSDTHRAVFGALGVAPPEQPRVVFIGMFGPRKGSADLPPVFERVAEAVPGVQFRLLGTHGMFKTADEVLAHFAPGLHDRIEVIPRYEPARLPELLSDCSVGVFPSYSEGFPLGVLEMLAAALPVVAYETPGAPEMLPPEWLVPPRATADMADRLIDFFRDGADLQASRQRARDRAFSFEWPAIAAQVGHVYRQALERQRSGRPAHPITTS